MPEKKRILLVSNAFYPEISPRSFRATELAKEFFRQGHEVTVFTKFRDQDYRDFLNEFPMNFIMWEKSSLPALPDFKKKPFRYISRGISRFFSILFEYPGIEEMFKVRRLLRNMNGYDLLISFAVPFPIHWGVAMGWSEKKPIAKTWIADCGDPYMYAKLDTFRKPFYFKYFEKDFCRKCSYITIPYKELFDQFYSQFRSKIRLIPQGFNFNDIQLHEEPVNNEKAVFIFAGTIIPGKRDLSLFFEYLSTLSLDYLFIIYTNQKEWFKPYKQLLGEKLELRGYVDRLKLIYELSKADFVVTVDTPYDKNSNTEAVPSKLIDYTLSTRPILNLNSANLDKKLVSEFLHKDYSRRRIIDISDYDIEKVSHKFLELCQD
jgi:hypothetical protein